MKKSNIVAVTELPMSPDQDRHNRMRNYLIAQGIRLVCIALCFVVQGWWLILPIVGAIIIPYVAVVGANNSNITSGLVNRPGAIVPVNQSSLQD